MNAGVERAYNKGLPIERCGQLWARWTDYCTGKFGQIVPFPQAETGAEKVA